MKCPAEIYQASPRPYRGLPDIDYPFHDRTIVVTYCGRICLGKKKINFSTVFAGQAGDADFIGASTRLRLMPVGIGTASAVVRAAAASFVSTEQRFWNVGGTSRR